MNDLAPIEHQPRQVSHVTTDVWAAMIERLVVNPAADLEKLERMLAMKERMDANQARISFAAAIALARAEIPPIIKDATVDFTSQKGRTHYRHETLAGIAKAIDPILSKYGLSYRFRTDQAQGGVKVTCVVSHAEGYSEETTLAGSPDSSGSKNSFQAVGSAVTYLQRYTLKAALGLSAEIDDDAQSAALRHDERRPAESNACVGGAAGPEKPPERDGPTLANDLIGRIGRASTSDDLMRIWQGVKFQAALDWLKDEKPELARQVSEAFDARSNAFGDFIPY
jgi:hypothetical protein